MGPFEHIISNLEMAGREVTRLFVFQEMDNGQ